MRGEVRPRALAHRGVVMAAGWWLDPALCGEDEARRRVLAHWENGARLFEVEGGNLLLFASPRPLRADIAPATVLVEREGWLLSAPLSDSEWQDLHPRAPSAGEIRGCNLALVRDGALLVARGAQALDPSLWLDVESWESVELEALGEVAALAVAATPAVDVRRALDVPTSPELARFLAQMRGEEMPDLRPSWRERWRAFWAKSGDGKEVEGGVRVEKRRFWLGKLFDFRFGAGGDAPPLREGENFSSEFGMVAHAFFVAALLSLLGSAFTWPSDGLGGVLALWGGLLLSLLPIAGLAWALMVLARLVPVPPRMARKLLNAPQSAWRRFFPLDLLLVMLLCGSFWVFCIQRDWIWMILAAALSFWAALEAHWARRRLDPVEVAARAATAGSGGWWQRLFGSKKGAGAGPRPRSGALQNFLWRTELARLFGARQARYMMRMVQMFERGDLDAALRHAVPFNVFGAGATHPALGTPKPRADLNFLGPRGAGGGAGFALPPQIKELLTKHYRAAHETLAAQNRLDEAAFVLAELLDSPAEAVQFLEKHQKWRTAAQLCEARELEAGLAVRLWWLAGERERAVAVARRNNAFADAVSRLERGDQTQREAARSLRLLWAHHCALAGDFAGAVEAAWPVLPHVPDARGVVGAWIERGLEGQGVAAAQMLARQAHFLDQLSPPTMENWRARTLQLLENADEEGVNLRLRFAALLCGAPSGELARAAARRTVRALARDGAQFPAWSAALKTQTKSLLDFASDGPLRVDVARHTFPTAPPRLETRTEPLSLVFEADDAGSLEIHDAALLPDGRALVALGEGGARLLHRDGKTLAVFDQPCHRLVMSPNGERAIGVALRGLEFAARFSGDKAALDEFIDEMGVNEFRRRAGLARLCRFDLARKSAQFWGEIAELSAHAPHFEAGGWLVASGDAILSLDPTAKAPLALWQTRDAGFAACLGSDGDSLAMLTHFYERNRRVRSEVWRFDLPSLTLRARRLVAPEDGDNARGIAPNGCLLVGRDANAKSAVVTDYEKKITVIERAQGETILQSEVGASWLAALSLVDEGVVIRLSRNALLHAQITLSGARRARFRLTDSSLVVGDNLGRLIALDLSTGAVSRNHRLF